MKTPDGLTLIDGWEESLEALYAVPERQYHSFAHVEEVLEHYWSCTWEHPWEVFAAVLFHDAIYVPGNKDNEDRSADLAVQTLPHWTTQSLDLDLVHRLILLTKRHGSLERDEITEEEARFLDCDMAILAADTDRFDAYDAGVAAEYGFLPPEIYAAGRRAFLEGLLQKDRIFLSDSFHQRLDARARANLRRVIQPRPHTPVLKESP